MSNLSLSLSHEYDHPDTLQLTNRKEGSQQHFLQGIEEAEQRLLTILTKTCCFCRSFLFVVLASLKLEVMSLMVSENILAFCWLQQLHFQTLGCQKQLRQQFQKYCGENSMLDALLSMENPLGRCRG
jgi:hypothetical protein